MYIYIYIYIYPPSPWNGAWKACDSITPSFVSLIPPPLGHHSGYGHFDLCLTKVAQKWSSKLLLIQTCFRNGFDPESDRFLGQKIGTQVWKMNVSIKLRFRGNICLRNQSLDHLRERKNPLKRWDSRAKIDVAYVAAQGNCSSSFVSKSVLKSSNYSLDFDTKNMCKADLVYGSASPLPNRGKLNQNGPQNAWSELIKSPLCSL